MSLPPALLKRLAQRGLVEQKQKSAKSKATKDATKQTVIDNEEVIAEDYDEMEEMEHPSLYESSDTVKRPEENFWLERMKLRIGEAGSLAGHKGCPNKYNIYHKCSLFCVNRWGEGHVEPSRDYIKRYKRLLRRYPLPKGWSEMYDPGCGCFYFYNISDNMVSWLPPTHPKSELSRCAAAFRRQMEEASTGVSIGGGGGSSEDEKQTDDENIENAETKHHKEIEEIIKHSMRSRSPPPPLTKDHKNTQDIAVPPPMSRKQKTRDLEKTLMRQRREKEREQERSGRSRRHGRSAKESDALDPMDPSAYSDIPRGKWSDGLNTGEGGERKKASKEVKSSKAAESDTDDEEN